MKLTTTRALKGAAVAILTITAQGQVPYLQFTTPDVTLQPGDSFSLSVQMVIPSGFASSVSGVDYWLGTDPSGAGKITALSGSLVGGVFDTWSGGAGLSFPQPLDVDNSSHTPGEWRNATDLGTKKFANPSVSLPGSYLVATFTMKLDGAIPVGDYPLRTTETDGLGWADGPPNFLDAPFSSQASMTIHVVPEPSGYVLVGGLGLLGFAAYRRISRDQSKA